MARHSKKLKGLQENLGLGCDEICEKLGIEVGWQVMLPMVRAAPVRGKG